MHRLHSYAAENGIDAYTVYADVGFSGLTSDRPAFLQMWGAIAAGQIKHVIALDMSCIACNAFDAMEFTEWTGQQGAPLITVTGDHRFTHIHRQFLSELAALKGGEQQ